MITKYSPRKRLAKKKKKKKKKKKRKKSLGETANELATAISRPADW